MKFQNYIIIIIIINIIVIHIISAGHCRRVSDLMYFCFQSVLTFYGGSNGVQTVGNWNSFVRLLQLLYCILVWSRLL